MEIETLKKFCGESPDWIMQPFNLHDGFTYATDGNVIVRVESTACGQAGALPMILRDRETCLIKKLPWSALEKRSAFRLQPETFRAVRERYLCLHCLTSDSLAQACSWCDGTRWNGVAIWCLRDDESVDKCYDVNPIMLQKMLDILGVIEFVEPPDQGPVGFRFKGGDGLLMPMRPKPWRKIVNIEKTEEKKE